MDGESYSIISIGIADVVVAEVKIVALVTRVEAVTAVVLLKEATVTRQAGSWSC